MGRSRDRINLEDIGYSEHFDACRRQASDASLVPARVIAQHKNTYVVRTENAELSARVAGKMMFAASTREDFPAVGDWVLISPLDKERAVIRGILPRKTVLARKSAGTSERQIIAANVDTAFIVQSPDRDYSLNRFERYSALAESENINPVMILNKTDLISDAELNETVSEIRERFESIDVHATSTVTGNGIDGLIASIERRLTYCFLGSSGVGKSSLINVMVGEELIETAEISQRTRRGRHATTHRELFILERGGALIDNPGMREIGVVDSDRGIQAVFSEINDLSKGCKYSDCTHTCEPGCAVLAAVDSGGLDKAKYDNYIKLLKENEYNTLTRQEKREKDRKFGKFIKTAKREIKKYKS